jgi:hypothetical protein
MNVEKWKNNKFIKNLKIKQYTAYPAEFMVFLCVTLFRQKTAEKRYTICILLFGLKYLKKATRLYWSP